MANKDIKLTLINPYLKQAPREQLSADIAELFTKFEVVRDYYQAKLFPESEADVLEKYKAIIRHEFFPTRGLGEARLSVARKAVTDYKKVYRSKASLADLMLYYVEIGVEFTTTYGDIDEPFYNSMESMYKKAVEYIVENELQEVLERRCRRIVRDTEEMGWGFNEALSEIYDRNFEG